MLACAMVAVCLGGCAEAQQIGSAQFATNGHAYTLGNQPVGPDRVFAWYDDGKAQPRGFWNYGATIGTDLTQNLAVGGAGAYGFYGFDRRSNWGVSGSVNYVWPQGQKGALVIGLGLGVRT